MIFPMDLLGLGVQAKLQSTKQTSNSYQLKCRHIKRLLGFHLVGEFFCRELICRKRHDLGMRNEAHSMTDRNGFGWNICVYRIIMCLIM